MNNKLHYDDTIGIMSKRKNPLGNISNKELEDITAETEGKTEAMTIDKKEEEYQMTLASTKVKSTHLRQLRGQKSG